MAYDFYAGDNIVILEPGTYLIAYSNIYNTDLMALRLIGGPNDTFIIPEQFFGGNLYKHANGGIALAGCDPVCAFRAAYWKIR